LAIKDLPFKQANVQYKFFLEYFADFIDNIFAATAEIAKILEKAG